MNYMEKNLHKRKDVKEILPSAKSIISLALNYYTLDHYTNENDNIKYCREKNCFSYSYIINSLFLSVNILICLFLILKKKLGFE